ncbi:MAG: glycine--tRNA ligase subunit beta [Burkholderiales bacterium]|nr:Glycine--tRNA ligase beta subunit [Rhodocyclaceae bacterium]MCZ2419183.1 glycine--tRNA ligase subunit beta [Burkholderiales bacterium]
MGAKNLLVELFVEELPPKALKKLGESFAATLESELRKEGLLEEGSVTSAFATPRRLAAHISRVRDKGPDKNIRKKLMPSAVAFDGQGKPTAALRKRMEKDGLSECDLARGMDGALESVFAVFHETGWSLTATLQLALSAAISGLPIPKVMTYQLQDGWRSVHFVRPAHRLVALHGRDVIDVDVLGLQAGRETQGHRFEAAQPLVTLRDADSYAEQMKNEGAVIASFAERRAEIESQLRRNAEKEGLKPIEDAALLDEVTALVERPNVLTCQFEKEFLAVPQECLILTMKANQKYFPLLDAADKLTNRFLVVSNIRPADPSAVIGGNERVVRPRLADAKFFFDQDRRKSLIDRIPGLARVVYHNKLGSQGERVERVAALARAIGQALGGEALANQADRAAVLSKADLLTDMVGEFPELQGIMGRYYALHDGEPAEIADAIEDHYKPRFAGDELPRGAAGICVALADKLQTLADMFGIGQLPTGDKDPFALRRHALGLVRMLIERDLPLELAWLFDAAKLADAKVRGQLAEFIYERLAGQLREQGYSALEVDAVLAPQPQRLGDIPKRLAAVRAFASLPEAASLAAANKRVGNILKKVSPGGTAPVDAALLKEPAEVALNAALAETRPKADAAFAHGDYAASLQALAALKGPVDAFFDHVMVNVEDDVLRANRLGLLATLHAAMNRVADLSKLSA